MNQKVNEESVYLNYFLRSIMAGVYIGIAWIINFQLENKILGAIMFAVGILAVVVCGLHLYTGIVGYTDIDFTTRIITLIGNLVGILSSTQIWLRVIYKGDLEELVQIANGRFSEKWIFYLITGFFCGLLVFEATVDLAGPMVSVFAISTFVMCGFRHSIAEATYLPFASNKRHAIFVWLLIVIGNFIGGRLMGLITENTIGDDDDKDNSN